MNRKVMHNLTCKLRRK